MGAAVSVAVTKMPDSLDEATLKKICGSRFDKKKFDKLKSADGFLSKNDLLEELAKPEYTATTTTVKVRALRSTFDQLLNQNLSTSQKVTFISNPSFHGGPFADTDDGETDVPVDTVEGESLNLTESNHSDVPLITDCVQVIDVIDYPLHTTHSSHTHLSHHPLSIHFIPIHLLILPSIHSIDIDQVDGIEPPDHVAATSEKSLEEEEEDDEDEEWRKMTEPQVTFSSCTLVLRHVPYICHFVNEDTLLFDTLLQHERYSFSTPFDTHTSLPIHYNSPWIILTPFNHHFHYTEESQHPPPPLSLSPHLLFYPLCLVLQRSQRALRAMADLPITPLNNTPTLIPSPPLSISPPLLLTEESARRPCHG